MDRISAKTLDCFVEFYSHVDAQATYNQFARLQDEGKTVRLQHRHVEILMSSQTALMGALFPRAKNIQWTGQKPVNVESNEPFNSGFKSFLLREELVMLVKFAEQPHRVSTAPSPFALTLHIVSTLHVFDSMLMFNSTVWIHPEMSLSYLRKSHQHPLQGRQSSNTFYCIGFGALHPTLLSLLSIADSGLVSMVFYINVHPNSSRSTI